MKLGPVTKRTMMNRHARTIPCIITSLARITRRTILYKKKFDKIGAN